jgi:FkbM family methyltransferase
LNLRALASRFVPRVMKNFLHGQSRLHRIGALVSPHLPPTICIDVGASYYPHVRWQIFLNAPEVRWVAVEPNEENLAYLKSWAWPCQVSSCTSGLSRNGGVQTLYVTNVDTGSSLLPPVIHQSMLHRVNHRDYFFPITERQIETITLEQAIEGQPAGAPVFVKLDTQGTELSILQGASGLFDSRRIVGIEMEATLLAEPLMSGAGKFWQACEFLEAEGFELLHIKPIQAVARSGRCFSGQNTFLNECDAVFALRRDVAAELPVEYRASLFGFYLTNLLYEEAAALLADDAVMRGFLRDRECNVEALKL